MGLSGFLRVSIAAVVAIATVAVAAATVAPIAVVAAAAALDGDLPAAALYKLSSSSTVPAAIFVRFVYVLASFVCLFYVFCF